MSDGPIEMPPSATWTPEQAIAAAARKKFAEVLVVGRDETGQIHVIDGGRLDLADILLLLEETKIRLFFEPVPMCHGKVD